ncbi:probable RNA-dependent RNA polymerase SHL2 [Ixodes scapularis]|uniref:probable RNA-dependent RNA polymerase SHL2 n=1 Tax=Ixodes scapularis TaxID=6945 RepID=UPI001A9FE099|nr:probable RNA-dependent RNA polymerase SHL2 [Ixodes scapularis]
MESGQQSFRTMSSKNTLSFVFLWIQDPRNTNGTYTSACRQFFESLECTSAARIHVSEPSPKLSNDAYEDPVYQAVCTVSFGDGPLPAKLEDLYGVIALRWCLEARKDTFRGRLQWLAPDRVSCRSWVSYENNIQLASVSFGTFVGLDVFAETSLISSQSNAPGYSTSCIFKHDEKTLHVVLRLRHTPSCTRLEDTYRLEVPYSSVVRVVVNDSEGLATTTDVFLHVRTLPLLYVRVEPTKSAVAQPTNPDHFIFNRALELGCRCLPLFACYDFRGSSVVKLSVRNKFKARQIVRRLRQRCDKGTEFFFSPMETCDVHCKLDAVRRYFHAKFAPQLRYSCCYALNALLYPSNDVFAQMALLKGGALTQLQNNLIEFALDNEAALEQAFFRLRSAIEERNVVTVVTAIPELFHKFRGGFVVPRVPPGSCMVRRIFVMPSGLVFLPPIVHRDNRVLRRFDSEYALRVAFRDDNMQHLSHSLAFHQQKDEMLERIVAKFLRDGIQLGDRKFMFLATSCSQLRDHGVWLYARDTHGCSAESIRRWMGDFSNIPSVAKKMARMGQCFSSTEESVKVPLDGKAVEDRPDIVGGKHPRSGRPFIFSDGIGMISQPLLEKVCKKLEMAQIPSAIQIRYAGYKGMLCVNPLLPGDKLVLRESMRKFTCSSSDSLEVIKVSAPRPVCLNRPLITILEQLGVPSRVFLCLQQKMVLMFADALVCESTALQVLCTYLSGALPFRRLRMHGLCLTRNPFVRSLLYTVYKSTMDGLHTKSRIAVPLNKGRNMLGVLDETDTLKYGQVFVQYTALGPDTEGQDDGLPKTRIVRGAVLVTKCPCLHPGDVRKFTAVDVPALHHVKDCVVFPARGPRPHPNEMAGSDLDGDEYVVIWKKDLLFPGPNRKAMVFSDHSATCDANKSLLEGMIQFVCNYIKNDNVGIMSNAHLAWADSLEDGIFSKQCLQIARKISTCLDFAKTGETSYLNKDEKPIQYPDFMEKGSSKDTYRSKRVLGHLYRLHRSLEAVVGTDFQTCVKDGDADCSLFALPGWEEYAAAAESVRANYASQMARIRRQYGIKSEGEVVAGLINSTSRYNTSNKDKTNVEICVEKQYRALVRATQERFYRDVSAACYCRNGHSGGVAVDVGNTVALRMASAWYMVTFSGARLDKNCQSFPWAIADVLVLVLKERSASGADEKIVPRNLLITKLNRVIAGEGREGELALNVIRKWATKEELTKRTATRGPGICEPCLVALFESFISRALYPATPVDEESPGSAALQHTAQDWFFGGQLPTVGGYVVGFLRYLSSAMVRFPECDVCNLSASHTHTATMAALRTYSMLALSRDPCHLGLPCVQSHEPLQEILEGNPVRIQVTRQGFMEMLRYSVEDVQKLLASWSGVQEVHIRGNSNRDGSYYILVSAIGRDWQRWYLEEVLLQPWLAEAVERQDLAPYLQA